MTNNDKVIKNRWKYTDKILNDVDKSLNNIFDDIKDELIELFNEFNVSSEDLNKKVSTQIKKKYERSKREWKKQGLITPYFQYLIDTTTKLTYSNLINLFILAIYLKYQKEEFDVTKNLLVNVANDTYKQAKQDLRKEDDDSIPKKLTWKDIAPWAIVMTIGVSIYAYLNVLNQLASEDSKKIYLTLINQEITPEEKYLTKNLKIQKNRFLKINGQKRSGVLENMSRQIGNKAYVEPFLNEKVRFIAEMDDRTTPMCRSLDGQIFNTKDWNDFWRYSDVRKDKKKYHIFGLKEGVNMPPIEDHFHWCRSVITYDLEADREDVEYEQIKNALKDNAPTKEEFFKIKENEKEYQKLLREKSLINKIKRSKQYSDAYKEKMIKTFYMFKNDGYELTEHAINRFLGPRKLRKNDFELTYDSVINTLKKDYNYIDIKNNRKVYYYDRIAVIQEDDGSIQSIGKRQKESNKWKKLDD